MPILGGGVQTLEKFVVRGLPPWNPIRFDPLVNCIFIVIFVHFLHFVDFPPFFFLEFFQPHLFWGRAMWPQPLHLLRTRLFQNAENARKFVFLSIKYFQKKESFGVGCWKNITIWYRIVIWQAHDAYHYMGFPPPPHTHTYFHQSVHSFHDSKYFDSREYTWLTSTKWPDSTQLTISNDSTLWLDRHDDSNWDSRALWLNSTQTRLSVSLSEPGSYPYCPPLTLTLQIKYLFSLSVSIFSFLL